MRSECGIPENGGRGSVENDRLEALEAEQRRERLWWEELREAFRAQNSEIGGLKEAVHGLEGDMLDQVAAVAGVVGEIRGLRRDMRIAPRLPLVSMPDWDPDEPTLSGREPEAAATVWRARAIDRDDKVAELQALLAAARATITATEAERRRNSERVDKAAKREWTKWEKIGAIIAAVIVAIITALGSGAGIAQLFGG